MLYSALTVHLQQVFQLWEVTPKSELGLLMLSGKRGLHPSLFKSQAFLFEHNRKEKGRIGFFTK